MLLPLPGPVETPLPPRPGCHPVLAPALATVLAATVFLPASGRMLATQPWAEVPIRIVALAEASWTLYADPVLFQPWQLWSWVLAGASSLIGAANAILATVLVWAVERRVGALWSASTVAILLPYGAFLHLLFLPAEGHAQVGAGGLVVALTGLAWGLLRPARLTLGLGWWAVVVAGWIPLGAIVLPWFGCLWAMLDGAIHGPAVVAVDAVLLVAGAGLGMALRLRVR